MQDREIVQQLVAGDRAALGTVYDRYATRLYDYCVGMLRDRDAAGDAVHDTLLVAADRAHQLRDPDKLRPWLYAIARNECHRALRSRRRESDLDSAGDVSDTSVDVERGLRAAEATALVRDAVAGLNPGDREILDLTLRHELAGDELGAALGVPANHANALLSRARAQLERAVGALVIARTGQQDCPELAEMLAGWDGVLTALVRKRVSRHIEKCAICGVAKAQKVSAAALFAAVPMAAIPIDLRSHVLENVSYQRDLGKRAEPFDRQGFPVPLDKRGRRIAPWIATGAAALLLIIAGTALWWAANTDDTAWETAASPSPPPVSESPPPPSLTPTPSPTPAGSPTPSLSPSLSPSASPTPSLSPTPSPTPSTVPPVLRIRASGGRTCGPFTSTVTAFVGGGAEPDSVTAFWKAADGAGEGALKRQRTGVWTGPLNRLPAGVDISVYAVGVTADGVSGQSNTVVVSNDPCPG